MQPVTLIVAANSYRQCATVAVSYDSDGVVTEVRSRYYARPDSLTYSWRRLQYGTELHGRAVRAAQPVRDTFAAFYSSREWENPLPYTWRGDTYPARAAFPLCSASVTPSLVPVVLQGYSRHVSIEIGDNCFGALIRPDTDLDSTFHAFDTDNLEWLKLNGWLISNLSNY